MALILPQTVPFHNYGSMISLKLDFFSSSRLKSILRKKVHTDGRTSLSVTVSSVKHFRDPSLDRHVVKQNKVRFVQKLKTLLLSKPKHYMLVKNLGKCRSYLSLAKPRSILSMIYRYPTIFELFTIPTPQTPLNATKPLSQLCVRLTPAASALAREEAELVSAMSTTLANKLQKLLMLSSHGRLLLSKLVHIAPDLGLPPNFRSRLCNDCPEKFKTVDTSYGRALELVSWGQHLANPLSSPDAKPFGLIVDRPLKFSYLRLRNGHNVRRSRQEFLTKFREMKDVCPYKTKVGELAKESIAAEKRACDVVREILGMTVMKRTLVDHLTHFRKELGLPNKLRAMLVRHPDLFYVSLKGQRDSVFLVEGYDDRGALMDKDETLKIRERLFALVCEGKRLRRDRRKGFLNGYVSCGRIEGEMDHEDIDGLDGYGDDLDDLFEHGGCASEDDDDEVLVVSDELLEVGEEREFWYAENAASLVGENDRCVEPW